MKTKLIQMIKFFGISGIGWLIDFTIYNSLIYFFDLNINIANMFSSLVGVTFVYIFSTKKLFVNHKIDIRIKYLIYIVYQIILILTVSEVLLVLKEYFINISLIKDYVSIVVKIIVTPFTMLINYVVVKNLIEKL